MGKKNRYSSRRDDPHHRGLTVPNASDQWVPCVSCATQRVLEMWIFFISKKGFKRWAGGFNLK